MKALFSVGKFVCRLQSSMLFKILYKHAVRQLAKRTFLEIVASEFGHKTTLVRQAVVLLLTYYINFRNISWPYDTYAVYIQCTLALTCQSYN
jgi:hypothetical protein